MIDIIQKEAERYDFPIIIVSNDGVARNSAAKRTRSLSRVSPFLCLDKKTKERVLLLTENAAAAVKSKRGAALVYRHCGFFAFLYLPMLENIERTPNEVFLLDVSARDLSELWSKLAVNLFPKRDMNASSFARIVSVAGSLCFSEDMVKTDLNGDGLIDAEKAFCALGQAIGELEFKDATELSDPPVAVSFSNDTLSVTLYGEEIYTEHLALLTAVAPYSFAENEYLTAFILAVAAAIFKSRK